MKTESQNIDKFIMAQKRVKTIKSFYTEVLIFLIITCVLIFVKGDIIRLFGSIGYNGNSLKWVDWNITFVPLFWGIILLLKAKCIFKFKFGFIERWEQRQIEKYMK